MAKKQPHRSTEKDFLKVIKPIKVDLKKMLLEGESIKVTIRGTHKRIRVTIKIEDED